jgi:hypothetical protein
LFSNDDLIGKIALRGGTALHKLFLEPPYRYSDDIDLVQTKGGPIGSVIDAIRSRLDPWLDKPRRERGPDSVTLTYTFESEIAPVRPMRLKIEINTREHFTLLGLKQSKFVVTNPWFTGECDIATFEMDELLATKLRALYQRRKGRDLGISRRFLGGRDETNLSPRRAERHLLLELPIEQRQLERQHTRHHAEIQKLVVAPQVTLMHTTQSPSLQAKCTGGVPDA